MLSESAFPRLTTANHEITSAPDVGYNCIAWAAGDSARWWQPGIFWPLEVPRHECGIGALEAAYGSGLMYTHAARQLPDGAWTSKLGKAEDIRHDAPDDIAGGVYGEVVEFMRRPVS
jgi:hypothetical protein